MLSFPISLLPLCASPRVETYSVLRDPGNRVRRITDPGSLRDSAGGWGQLMDLFVFHFFLLQGSFWTSVSSFTLSPPTYWMTDREASSPRMSVGIPSDASSSSGGTPSRLETTCLSTTLDRWNSGSSLVPTLALLHPMFSSGNHIVSRFLSIPSPRFVLRPAGAHERRRP